MRLYRQYLTNNDCYRTGRSILPRGVMLHSTGANNPNLSRYVPGDEVIGKNTAGNHWDQSNAAWRSRFGVPLNKCVHAFIGRLADGSVGTVQTLPWTMMGWHAGGDANAGYIGFEICEDDLDDPEYFAAVYREAVELTAYLCGHYGLDPLEEGVVLCHAEGYRRGVASNHADVLHWFPKFGRSMDDFRRGVKEVMEGGEPEMAAEQFKQQFEQLRRDLRTNDHGDWSAQALEWAVEQGLFSGTSGVDGRPNYMWQDLLTREQLAVVLYQFARQLRQ